MNVLLWVGYIFFSLFSFILFLYIKFSFFPTPLSLKNLLLAHALMFSPPGLLLAVGEWTGEWTLVTECYNRHHHLNQLHSKIVSVAVNFQGDYKVIIFLPLGCRAHFVFRKSGLVEFERGQRGARILDGDDLADAKEIFNLFSSETKEFWDKLSDSFFHKGEAHERT